MEEHPRHYIKFTERGKLKLADSIEVEGKNYAIVEHSMRVYKIIIIMATDVTLVPVRDKKTIEKVIAEFDQTMLRNFRPGLLTSY